MKSLRFVTVRNSSVAAPLRISSSDSPCRYRKLALFGGLDRSREGIQWRRGRDPPLPPAPCSKNPIKPGFPHWLRYIQVYFADYFSVNTAPPAGLTDLEQKAARAPARRRQARAGGIAGGGGGPGDGGGNAAETNDAGADRPGRPPDSGRGPPRRRTQPGPPDDRRPGAVPAVGGRTAASRRRQVDGASQRPLWPPLGGRHERRSRR